MFMKVRMPLNAPVYPITGNFTKHNGEIVKNDQKNKLELITFGFMTVVSVLFLLKLLRIRILTDKRFHAISSGIGAFKYNRV